MPGGSNCRQFQRQVLLVSTGSARRLPSRQTSTISKIPSEVHPFQHRRSWGAVSPASPYIEPFMGTWASDGRHAVSPGFVVASVNIRRRRGRSFDISCRSFAIDRRLEEIATSTANIYSPARVAPRLPRKAILSTESECSPYIEDQLNTADAARKVSLTILKLFPTFSI